jgi:hypothetical protein
MALNLQSLNAPMVAIMGLKTARRARVGSRWPLTGQFRTSTIPIQPGVESSARLDRRKFLGIAASRAAMLGQAPKCARADELTLAGSFCEVTSPVTNARSGIAQTYTPNGRMGTN